MKKSLLVVDYQYDFVAEDGLLTVGESARKIENNICNKINIYTIEHTYFTFDLHQKKDWVDKIHPETKIFQEHCIEHTKGYNLYGKLKDMRTKNLNYINKKAYCPDHNYIKDLVSRYDCIEVCGVVTDICVFQTVIGLYTYAVNNNKPLKLKVDKNCCASFNLEREVWSLKYLKDVLGIEVEGLSITT